MWEIGNRSNKWELIEGEDWFLELIVDVAELEIEKETPPSTKFVFTGFTALAKRFMNFISRGTFFKDFVSKYNEQKKSQKDVNQERK